MGQRKSKPSGSMGMGKKDKLPDIPPDSPLGLMIRYWDSSPKRKNKSKEKMINYCIEIWGGKPLSNPHVLWPVFGSFEDWVCQQLNIWVNNKRPPVSPEESEYAALWIPQSWELSFLFALRENRPDKPRKDDEDPLWPPPYAPHALPPQDPPQGQEIAQAQEGSDSEPHSPTPAPPPRRSVRNRIRRGREGLFPLQEMLVPGGDGRGGRERGMWQFPLTQGM